MSGLASDTSNSFIAFLMKDGKDLLENKERQTVLSRVKLACISFYEISGARFTKHW